MVCQVAVAFSGRASMRLCLVVPSPLQLEAVDHLKQEAQSAGQPFEVRRVNQQGRSGLVDAARQRPVPSVLQGRVLVQLSTAEAHAIAHLLLVPQVMATARNVLGYVVLGSTALLLVAEKLRRSAVLPGNHEVWTVQSSRWHRIALQVGHVLCFITPTGSPRD